MRRRIITRKTTTATNASNYQSIFKIGAEGAVACDGQSP
jgi:hypothetical protein